ncbi:MAG: efflux RND transporter periplasmic adaptor subunit [Candidatus Tectomicrobia bacterium]|nr:efflux RND transporter periplasmic adaptor subunit [Candidatus Tectomicrobia bacterium]
MSPSRSRRWRGGALALLLLGGVSAADWSAAAWGQGFGPMQVEVAAVRSDRVRSTIGSVGTIVPELSSTISSEVEGQVRTCKVEIGDRLKAGQVICQIDGTTKEIEVRAARAELRKAQANLAKLKRGLRPEEIAQRRATVESRRANARRLQQKLERAEMLRQQNVISLNDVQEARLTYEAADADLQRAVAELAEAEAGSREEDILAAEAEAAARQANVERLLDEVRKFSVKAPFDGLIAAKHVEVGEHILPGGKVVDLLKLDTVYALTEISEKHIGMVRKGLAAEVRADALPRKLFRGTVEHIAPRANVSTRAFPVKIAIENPRIELMGGMFVRLQLVLDERLVTLVPKDAIVDRDGPTVFVVLGDGGNAKPKTVRAVRVTTGVAKGEYVAVDGEVAPGQQVVVLGNESLRSGSPVRILKE